ncbi:TetR/AcrR family transcriptional regulator [Oceanobacillus iheyensis]|uniref:TetR/AcrR family transcriptional regulator n=1 Tax=Oceanobacillus iheyensis TaxID=182710 RepID=UPI00362C1342
MHTKDKILFEGMELFARQGYEGTSMTNIANAVGIKKSSLYAHYKNKAGLFLDVTQKISSDYIDFVKKSLMNEGKNIQETLYLSFLSNVHDLANNDSSIEFFNRFISYPPEELKERLLTIMLNSEQNARTLFEDTIKKGQDIGEITTEVTAKEAANVLYGLLDGLSYETSYYTFDIIEKHGEQMWKVFWRGIKA